jgi:hypothetical protein
MKTISASIDIDAPPAAVWAVLTDLSSYPEWNPLLREAAGEIAVGKRLTFRAFPANGRPMTIRPRVLVAEPGAELRWMARIPGVIGGEHSFTLSPANGGTHVVQSETFRGILVPISAKNLASSAGSFRALNEALKERAESRR